MQVLVGAVAVHHAPRDVLATFHELLGGERFACVLHASHVLRVVCWTDEYHATDPDHRARRRAALVSA